MKPFIFPAAIAILLTIFFVGLPDISKFGARKICENEDKSPFSLTLSDMIAILFITLLFGFVDFTSLGNRNSPETFIQMGDEPVNIIFDNPAYPSNIMLFSGVSTGEYIIELSSNGDDYETAAQFSQTYDTVLKWNRVSLSAQMQDVKYARIYATSAPFLGEAVFLDTLGNVIPCRSDSKEICDEQQNVPSEITFMNSSYFDEIYHARTAWEHMHNVYPYEISHPPLGKLIILLGIALFGMTPFGWRFSGTFFGVLMLPIIYIFIKKLFGSTRTAICGTLLLATDFMHYVQTRIATIDTYAVFFILLMYMFMYDFIKTGKLKSLALSGIFFGLGAASKWTCIYAGAGLAVIWAAYWIINRKKGFKKFAKNSAWCIVFFITVPCIIYYLSYIPYGKAMGIQGIFNKDYFTAVISNQEYMFSYHSALVAEHPYSSKWYYWILNIRPILYYLEYYPENLRSSFGAFLNPMLCWGGLLAIFVLLYRATFKKDTEAAFIITGYFAQLIPWMFVTRLTFEYHYFPCSIFLVLAVAYVFSLMENSKEKHAKSYIIAFTALSALLFITFYPVLSGQRIDSTLAVTLYHWLPTWPF